MSHFDRKTEPTLWQLIREFLLMGAISFGAGMFSLIYERIVHQRRWMDERTFRDGITFSELAPGPFTLHVVMYIGYHFQGLAGLIWATLAFSFPSIILVVILAMFHHQLLEQVPGMLWFITGVWAAIFAILLSTILKIGKQVFRDPILILLALSSFAAVFFYQFSFVLLIIATGLIYLMITSLVRNRAWRQGK